MGRTVHAPLPPKTVLFIHITSINNHSGGLLIFYFASPYHLRNSEFAAEKWNKLGMKKSVYVFESMVFSFNF
jgi:hypothetical protein